MHCIKIYTTLVALLLSIVLYQSNVVKVEKQNTYRGSNEQVDNQVINIGDLEVTSEKVAKQPDKYSLDVKPILQNPELPTGCEITSLCIVLQYLGYDISKTELVDKYLEQADGYADKTFDDVFIGSPYEDTGWGCYAPVIERTANKYFMSINNLNNAKAVNVSGISVADITRYIWLGKPVIVWVTIGMDESIEEEYCWTTSSGKEAYFAKGEHCVVVIGYDLSKGEIVINDPLDGITTVNIERFESVYNAMHRQAVIINQDIPCK